MMYLSYFRPLWVNQKLFNQNAALASSVRTLFSEKNLGITEYETQRLRMPNIKFDQKKMVFEMKTNNIEALVKTTKQWIHCMNKQQCEADIMLLQQSLRQIHKKGDSSTSYNFGPTLMRMFHYFNLPNEALKLTFDLQISDLFNQLSSTLILCDMLFNNAMYKELLQVIHKNRNIQQKKGMNSSRLQNYLAFAACYKLNTKDHLDYGLQIWYESVKEHQLNQSMNFLAMLCINQNQPEIALEILPKPDKHFSSINVRLIALTDCRHYAEAVQILKNTLADIHFSSYKISDSVIQRVRDTLNKNPPTEDSIQYNNLLSEVQQQMRTTKTTIDEMLCWPISAKLLDKHQIKSKSELL